MPSCQVIGCSNTSGKCKKGLFSIPDPARSLDHRRLCQKWLMNIKNPRFDIKTFKAHPSYKVCEDHFTRDSFTGVYGGSSSISLNNAGRLRLKKDAVPTVFPSQKSDIHSQTPRISAARLKANFPGVLCAMPAEHKKRRPGRRRRIGYINAKKRSKQRSAPHGELNLESSASNVSPSLQEQSPGSEGLFDLKQTVAHTMSKTGLRGQLEETYTIISDDENFEIVNVKSENFESRNEESEIKNSEYTEMDVDITEDQNRLFFQYIKQADSEYESVIQNIVKVKEEVEETDSHQMHPYIKSEDEQNRFKKEREEYATVYSETLVDQGRMERECIIKEGSNKHCPDGNMVIPNAMKDQSEPIKAIPQILVKNVSNVGHTGSTSGSEGLSDVMQTVAHTKFKAGLRGQLVKEKAYTIISCDEHSEIVNVKSENYESRNEDEESKIKYSESTEMNVDNTENQNKSFQYIKQEDPENESVIQNIVKVTEEVEETGSHPVHPCIIVENEQKRTEEEQEDYHIVKNEMTDVDFEFDDEHEAADATVFSETSVDPEQMETECITGGGSTLHCPDGYRVIPIDIKDQSKPTKAIPQILVKNISNLGDKTPASETHYQGSVEIYDLKPTAAHTKSKTGIRDQLAKEETYTNIPHDEHSEIVNVESENFESRNENKESNIKMSQHTEMNVNNTEHQNKLILRNMKQADSEHENVIQNIVKVNEGVEIGSHPLHPYIISEDDQERIQEDKEDYNIVIAEIADDDFGFDDEHEAVDTTVSREMLVDLGHMETKGIIGEDGTRVILNDTKDQSEPAKPVPQILVKNFSNFGDKASTSGTHHQCIYCAEVYPHKDESGYSQHLQSHLDKINKLYKYSFKMAVKKFEFLQNFLIQQQCNLRVKFCREIHCYCIFVDDSTMTKHDLVAHKRIAFVCGQYGCNKVCSDKGALRSHEISDHAGYSGKFKALVSALRSNTHKVNELRCNKCGQTFTTTPKLRSHKICAHPVKAAKQ